MYTNQFCLHYGLGVPEMLHAASFVALFLSVDLKTRKYTQNKIIHKYIFKSVSNHTMTSNQNLKLTGQVEPHVDGPPFDNVSGDFRL